MKILCDQNIPHGLVQALQQSSSVNVTKIQSFNFTPPIKESKIAHIMGYGYDVFLTAVHAFLRRNTNYGVLHYHDPTASDSAVVSKIERIARKSHNPYTNIGYSVP